MKRVFPRVRQDLSIRGRLAARKEAREAASACFERLEYTFAKTGAHRQGELVALLSRSPTLSNGR